MCVYQYCLQVYFCQFRPVLKPSCLMTLTIWIPERLKSGKQVEFGLLYTSGNTETESLKGKLNISRDVQNWRHKGVIDYYTAEQEDQSTVSQLKPLIVCLCRLRAITSFHRTVVHRCLYLVLMKKTSLVVTSTGNGSKLIMVLSL